MRRVWRQFRPVRKLRTSSPSQSGLFEQTRQALKRLLGPRFGSDWRGIELEQLRQIMARHDEMVLTAKAPSQQVEALVGLMLRTPGAVQRQSQVDALPHGYKHPENRIYELIDFNDAFVASVLSLTPQQLPGFADGLQREMDWFCRQLRTPMFRDEQYQAITRGLGREIAVYLGATEQGLVATMGSRIEDAKGVDMVVTDPLTNRSISIDCKTPPAYRHRLEDLIREGRISDQEARIAESEDYCVVESSEPGRRPLILFCVRAERYGEVVDFRFRDSESLGERLRMIIKRHGEA